jgi:hypothetical protein
MFPRGLPGVALISLRLSVAVALQTDLHAARDQVAGFLYAAATSLAVSLGAGLLTPIGACIAIAAHTAIWARVGVSNPAQATMIALDALALALLGPGAYSIDGYRFGRRVVVPPSI